MVELDPVLFKCDNDTATAEFEHADFITFFEMCAGNFEVVMNPTRGKKELV